MASPLVREGPLVADAPRRADAPPAKDGSLESMQPSVAPGPAPLDYRDLQGLVRFGHGHMSEVCFFLLEVADREAAWRWLQSAPVGGGGGRATADDSTAGGIHGRGAAGAGGRRRGRRGLLRRIPRGHDRREQPFAPARRHRRQRPPANGTGAAPTTARTCS